MKAEAWKTSRLAHAASCPMLLFLTVLDERSEQEAQKWHAS
jgi:hypothetical protein